MAQPLLSCASAGSQSNAALPFRRPLRAEPADRACPAVARRRRHAPAAAGGAAGDPPDPRRPAHDRNPGRPADRHAAVDVRARRRSRLAADRAGRRGPHRGRRPVHHVAGRRRARCRVRPVDALRHDHRDGLRRRHHAARAADAGAAVGAGPRRARHRGVEQRPAGRRRRRSRADHSAGAAAGRAKLAAGPPGVVGARADRRAAVSRGGDALARRNRKPATSPRPGSGGRTGRTR